MADRTWNAVESRLYEESWGNDAKIVAGILIARTPNPYGVYKTPYWLLENVLEGVFTVPGENIRCALGELEEVGFLKEYRDRTVIWIRKKWKREAKGLKHRKGAHKTITEDYPEVWDDFLDFYRDDLEPLSEVIETPSKGVGKGLERHPKGYPSESESESDTESKKNKTKKVLTHPAKFEPKHLKCVQELAAKAQKLNKRFVSVEGKDGEKQAAELAVIDRNGDNPRYRTILQRDYCWELLEEALWWAMEDDFLGQQLQSVSGLRKTWKNGMPKWVNVCARFLDDNLKRFGQDWLSKGERRERSREKNPHKQSGDTAILVKEVADGLRDPYPKPPLEDYDDKAT